MERLRTTPSVVARVRALASGESPPAPARPAATVALLREAAGGTRAGAGGIEVYLLRRVASVAFAAGMHVFPGGVVDPRDADEDLPWSGPLPVEWAGRLSADPALVAALTCAAVRETFEESGVLLAGPQSGPQSGPRFGDAAVGATGIVGDTAGEEWETDRLALCGHEAAFSDLLRRRRLVLRADLLRPWAHWITPEHEERRYDTRFFVAALPTAARTREVGGEADRAVWVRPAQAVAAYERGELPMLTPTITTLRELAAYDAVADVLDAADRREVRPLLLRPVLRGDAVELLHPDEPGYAGAAVDRP